MLPPLRVRSPVPALSAREEALLVLPIVIASIPVLVAAVPIFIVVVTLDIAQFAMLRAVILVVPLSMFNALVAPPAKLTVVAVALTKLKVELVVERVLPLTANVLESVTAPVRREAPSTVRVPLSA